MRRTDELLDELLVVDIQRFALHDGPGIRSTVFLKGCPLHCPWCANPESQSSNRQLMFFENKCVACGECAKECAGQCPGECPGEFPAITCNIGHPSFDRELCRLCGSCAEKCLHEAIEYSGQIMKIEDILNIIMKDKDYYDFTGGGITVSGGEPFVQAEQMMLLLKMAKANGLHTALESCGHVPPEVFTSALKYTDLLLFDMKHVDAEILQSVCGADLSLILENLKSAVSAGCEVIARIPVIPGFNNDSIDDILRMAKDFGVRQTQLLPYHQLGKNKYTQLGLPYLWEDHLSKYPSLCIEGEIK